MRKLIIAVIALAVVAGGTAVAAKKVKGTQLITKKSATGDLVRNSTITGAKVKNNSLKGADVDEASLAKVASAAGADTATVAGTAGSAATAADAAKAATADTATTAGRAGTAVREKVTRSGPLKLTAPATDADTEVGNAQEIAAIGPFRLTARCVNLDDSNTPARDDDNYYARLVVTTVEDNQVVNGGNVNDADIDTGDAETMSSMQSNDTASPAFAGVEYYNWLRLYRPDGTLLARLDAEVGARVFGADCFFALLRYETDY